MSVVSHREHCPSAGRVGAASEPAAAARPGSHHRPFVGSRCDQVPTTKTQLVVPLPPMLSVAKRFAFGIW